ncbi:anti-sigma factor [Aliikangiella coralliicola]|uniref:Anti-sigma K factor RskA C-terminal domain-containing protein n=1 Tax=Aliikangiella coralliicola TaxID=2592383 RepID=A0A545U009_9GAMM|nr:anti-sigma factor [Aliikangiella coralliicola]TQV82797.1 hypothetical protein FLL46_23795 [Aliikangiella coralliicola]
MSGSENANSLNNDSAAFEYVVGTLRGKARTDFEALMRQNESLRFQVSEWEERLMNLNTTELTRTPTKDNWSAIENRINTTAQSSHQSKPGLLARLFWLPWLLTGVMTVLLMFNSTLFQTDQENGIGKLPIDYMAVMTTNDGKAALSAVASGDARRMWLRWEDNRLEADQDFQLWAVSRSDGEIRSISVIANSDTEVLELSEAEWRLVKDADSLLLTVEDEGGSPIDEPSDNLVAKGLCVRLTRTDRDV